MAAPPHVPPHVRHLVAHLHVRHLVVQPHAWHPVPIHVPVFIVRPVIRTAWKVRRGSSSSAAVASRCASPIAGRPTGATSSRAGVPGLGQRTTAIARARPRRPSPLRAALAAQFPAWSTFRRASHCRRRHPWAPMCGRACNHGTYQPDARAKPRWRAGLVCYGMVNSRRAPGRIQRRRGSRRFWACALQALACLYSAWGIPTPGRHGTLCRLPGANVIKNVPVPF